MASEPTLLGKLIHQQEDDEGPINIYQKHNLRYLTFGNNTEQSCLTLDKPHRLEHVYTQAMMLALLLKEDIRSALLLGLGGGGLARALRHSRPKLKIDAVEYRQSVIDIATDFFGLPDDDNFKALCDDAAKYIETTQKTYDLVFADLYLPEGMDETQLNDAFLENCRDQINEHGIMVINFWTNDFRQTLLRQQAIKRTFGENALSLHVRGGNDIIFAFKNNIPKLNKRTFISSAQQLGLKLDIPLQNLAGNLWQSNARALQFSQYR